MNFILISNTLINCNAVTRVQRIAANNFTVYFNDGSNFPGLTRAQIDPLLNAIGFQDL